MLVRWDPFEEMNRLQSQMFGGGAASRWTHTLAVDIAEDDNAFVVEAEVPGMKAEDIHVDVEKNVLTIRGERSSESEESTERFRRVERSRGTFTRSFSLPETVDTESIAADLKDGVLTLRLPKVPAQKPRTVAIKAA